MAYLTKYHFQITDNRGVTTIVRLKLRDYVGDDTDLTLGGVTFEFGQNRASGVVRGSSAKVGLWSLTQGQFAEFRDITDRKWMVEVLKGGQPYWYGWLTPEIFSEPFKHSTPYRVELTAADGLGDLQNVDYLDLEGNRYTGRESFKSIFNHCLNSVSFGLNVCFSSSIRPSGTSGDMFEDAYYSNDVLVDNDGQPLKCSQVLDQFFPLGITVKQWRGKWYVMRTEDLTDNTLVYEYDSAGNYIDDYYLDLNYTIDDTASVGAVNLPIDQSGILSQDAAYKEAKIKVNFGKKPSILNNCSFSKPGDAWTDLTGDLQYKEGQDKTYGKLLNMDAQGAITGIHQTVEVVATEEDFAFSIKVAPFAYHRASGSNKLETVQVAVKFQVKLTASAQLIYYLDKTIGWTTTPCFIDIEGLESSVSGTNITWHDIKIFTESLPASGTLDVFLCKLPRNTNYPPITHLSGVGYTDVYAYPEGESYLSSREIKGINNPDYNYIPAVAELKINDCPDVPNARLIYTNFISNSEGVPTTGWTLDGVEGSMTIAELYLRHIISLHRRPVKVISMTMRGSVEWPGTLSDKEGNRYEVVSATLMDRNCEWQLELREILAYGEGTPAISEGARIYDKSASSTRTVNGNNDYRTYVNGIGSPKRINDLTRANALEDAHRVEVDKPGATESQYVEATQIDEYIKAKLGVTVEANKTTWDRDLHVEGNITASQKVIAWVAGAVSSDVLANLSASAPLRKSSASNLVLDYNGDHFEVTGGALQIKSGVLVPATHSHVITDITNLQTVLDGKMVIHTHPYRPDTWVPDWADVTGKPLTFVPSTHGHVISEVTGLQGALDAKMAIHTHPYKSDGWYPTWEEVTGKPLTFVPSAHNHIISEVTGLQTALDGKMAIHTHPYRADTWVPAWSEITSKPEWVAKMGWDGTAVTVASTLRITGNLEASEKVIAWVAGAVGSSVLASLTATAPLRKSTDSNIVLDYNTTQFEVNVSNQLQIKSGILAPAAHSHIINDVTGLQVVLDTYLPLTGGTITRAASASDGSINIESTDPTLRFRITGGTVNKRIYEWRAIAGGGSSDYFQLRLWDDAQSTPTQLVGITSAGALSVPSDIFAINGNSTQWNEAYSWGNHVNLYAPFIHSHVITDITNLQTVLDGKMAIHTHPYRADTWVPDWADVTGKPLTFVPSAHNHIISEVTGLQTALDAKMAIHTHPYLSDADSRITQWSSAYSAIYGSPLTSNYIPKWDGGKFVNSGSYTNDVTGALLAQAGGLAIYGGAIPAPPTAESIIIDRQIGGAARVMASSASDWNAPLALNPYGGFVGAGYTSDPQTNVNKFAVNGNAYIGGIFTATGAITSNNSFIIKNSSGVTKWTLTLGSDDRLEIKNAAGVVVNMITQSGEQHSANKLTAHSTSI